MVMTSSRSYLANAIYNWIVDNQCTPHILINNNPAITDLPPQFLNEKEIVLNISPTATRELNINTESITFLTKFNGNSFNICIPIIRLLAIYAKETQQGIILNSEPLPITTQTEDKKPNSKKPTLKVIK